MGTDKTPSPEQFWQVFAKEISDRLNCISNKKKVRCYNVDKKWTGFMRRSIKIILKKFEYSINEISPEYLRIDYTVCPGESNVRWNLDIAIEHENKPGLWEDELTKLVHINCGLRVLISYYDNKKDRDLVEIKEKILNNISQRKYYQEDQKWVFIFGPYDLIKEGDFVAFKLENKQLLELEKYPVLRIE